MITHTIDDCSYCKTINSIITVFSAGEVVCSNCGVVFEDRIIDETYEGRNFNNENPGSGGKDQNRVGVPINSEEMNLVVSIGSKTHSSLSKIRQRTSGTSNNSLSRIYKRVDELAQKLDLATSIVDKTRDLLSTVEKQKRLKGRSLDCIIASVIYVACRFCRVPRTIHDILNSLQLDKKAVGKCFNSIKGIIIENTENQIIMNVTGLINSYCNKLEMTNNIKKLAVEIAELICKNEVIAGRSPSTIAATSLYIALKLLDIKMSKKDISDKTKTTENTIHNAYQELLKFKEIIIPEAYKSKLDSLY